MQAPRAIAGLSLDGSKTPFVGGGRATTSSYNNQVSISLTYYLSLFGTKELCAAFL